MSPIAVLSVAGGYLLLLFLVAWFAGRRADNVAFFVGGRRTPRPLASLAMMSAAMSGVTFISLPGSVATDAFSYLQMVAGFTVGQVVVAYLLVPTFYRLRVISLYEYLDQRFGACSHRTGAWFFFLSKMLGGALRIYVVCVAMQQLVFDYYGVPFWVNASIVMLLVWLYTQRGGVKTLGWTDAFKSLCLLATLFVTIYLLCDALSLSLSEVVQEVRTSPRSQILFLAEPSSERYFWKMFFAGIVLLVAMTGLDQDMMQRNLSCPTPRDAQKTILVTAVSQIFVILLFLLLGFLLLRYAEFRGLPLPEKSDHLFGLVAVHGGLPWGVGLLFVVGLIASTYSAAGSALTALTTSFTVDVMQTTKRADEKRVATTRRWVHLAMAGVMTLVILLFERWADESLINLVYRVASYTYGPILGLFLFGLLTRRRVRDGWVPVVALVAPLLSVALQLLARAWWGYQIGFELLVYNAAFTMVGLCLLSKNE